uniref:Putative Fe(II) oxygenase superfamily protein n=1 Tax=Linum usitatissimum TaxID=4006 RepID=I6YMC5_LINUS|nr:putative Fe(II) oxygenase superfamily protein [Linum usitatissimum]
MEEEQKELPNKLGKCLPVPWVQELAKDPLFAAAVPPRYIRQPHDAIVSSAVEVPVIDLRKIVCPPSTDDVADDELGRLHEACKHWGFFQLVNHGVSNALVERVKKEIQEWFDIPMEEKKKFWQRYGDLEGFGQAFVVSEEQKLDWGDMFYITSLPTHLRRPYLFPLLPLSLRNTLEEYSAALKSLAMKILNLMAEALGMDRTDMNVLFGEEGWQQFRMNYYPPCPQPELVMGLNSHSDAVGLTILLQVTSDTPGLQVKNDGYWVPVTPLPDALIVNVGDILEIVSNGVYKSVEHRATVNSKKERISVATFLSPRNTLEEYSAALKSLAMKILNLMAEALGMDRTDMNVLFGEEGWQQFRMNYYPPCPQPELVMGLNSHSDAVGLTILLQVTSDTPGLQVKNDGYWVPVTPLPDALIVNVGDILEIVSNGVYKSVEHRATVNSKKERISVATFLSPRLHDACKDWGFFQLVNHGVSDSLVERVKKEIKEWFSIPMEEKKKFWQRCGDLEGFGQAFVVSQEQKLDWGDMVYLTSLPTHERRPYLFPLLPLTLRDTLEEYSTALKSLAMKILNLMAKALGMDQNDMNVLFDEEGWQLFRMNYYPPCPQPELVMGLNSHSDIVGLTILLEVTSDTPAGLQVKKRWILGSGERQSARIRALYLKAILRQDIGYFDTETTTGEVIGRMSGDIVFVQDAMGEKAAAYKMFETIKREPKIDPYDQTGEELENLKGEIDMKDVPSGYRPGEVHQRFQQRCKVMYEETSQVGNDAVGGMRTVASFCAENKVIHLYHQKCKNPIDNAVRAGVTCGFGFGFSFLVLNCINALLFYLGAKLVKKGMATFQDVFKVFFALTIAAVEISQSSGVAPDSRKAKDSAASIFAILDRKPRIDSSVHEGITLENLTGDIELQNVSFRYPMRPNVQVFRDLSLTIPSGKTVALVGESGSGKSTVISLIERFYDPESGTVFLDKVDLKKLKLTWLRQQMGLVGQEPILFNDTIRANISYGKHEGGITRKRSLRQPRHPTPTAS